MQREAAGSGTHVAYTGGQGKAKTVTHTVVFLREIAPLRTRLTEMGDAHLQHGYVVA
jgi:hypothetical protein